MKQSISSITTGPRQSNMELLRIYATLLVLIVHADFFSVGAPTSEDFANSFLGALSQTIIESISVVAVNVFILISGWFGIRVSFKGISNFLFQCAFFLFGIYGVLLLIGQTSLSITGLAECFCLTKGNWFIKSYLALYILSPALNYFAELASKRSYQVTLISFFLFQTIWGWTGAAEFIKSGYSGYSFIGLYLLARYLNKYGVPRIRNCGGWVYIAMSLLITIGYYIQIKYHLLPNMYSYVNPLVIVSAIGLLVFFDRIRIKPSKFINWIAKSTFAVFLLHTNPNFLHSVFTKTIQDIYSTYSGGECILLIFGFLVVVFILGILFDQPRKWCWIFISNKLTKKL